MFSLRPLIELHFGPECAHGHLAAAAVTESIRQNRTHERPAAPGALCQCGRATAGRQLRCDACDDRQLDLADEARHDEDDR